MNEQRMKIEMEALRSIFKHAGQDVSDSMLEALVTWPENTKIDKAVRTVIDVVIALEIGTAMKRIIEEVKIKPKFPDGGIFYGGGRNSGGEYVINPKQMNPFPWADAPTISFVPEEQKELGHKIVYEPRKEIDYGDAAWKMLCETLNNRDGKEGTEEDISIQGEEDERPAGPGHVCDMDEPPE